jgi:hypothetical protein
LRNRTKSQGARSGEWRGGEMIVMFLETRNCRTTSDVWAGALSWWRNQLFFHLSGRLRRILSYDLTNIMDSSPTICKDSLAHFCDVFRCCACRRSSRTLTSSTDVRPPLKRLYHKKVLLWLIALSPNASLSIRWVSAAVLLSLKRNLMQILCSLKSALSVGEKIAEPLKHDVTETHVTQERVLSACRLLAH